MPRARLREDLENIFVIAQTRIGLIDGFLQICNQHGRDTTFISMQSVMFPVADLISKWNRLLQMLAAGNSNCCIRLSMRAGSHTTPLGVAESAEVTVEEAET